MRPAKKFGLRRNCNYGLLLKLSPAIIMNGTGELSSPHAYSRLKVDEDQFFFLHFKHKKNTPKSGKDIYLFLVLTFLLTCKISLFCKKIIVLVSLPASWSSGNALVSGAEGLRLKSRTGQIGHSVTKSDTVLPTVKSDKSVKSDTVLPTARQRCDILRKELCCPGAMTRRWAPPTRYMLRRNTASIMKDLI